MFFVPVDGSNELPSPWPIYERLRLLPEHAYLKHHSPPVAWLFREGEWLEHGKLVLGKTFMPRVQGGLRELFDDMLEKFIGFQPVFLFVLNAEWWHPASDRDREALVFHEMLHASIARDQYGALRFNRQTGEPVWTLRAHDVEEFNEVARRYGAWSPDIAEFLNAAREGGK